MPNLGPSERLIRQFRTSDVTWAAFARSYKRELFEGASTDQANSLIRNHGQKSTLHLLQRLADRGPVTIMCHCSEEQKQSHPNLLLRILGGRI
jgi:uncharacterized protein YeaO (DUF488 family)